MILLKTKYLTIETVEQLIVDTLSILGKCTLAELLNSITINDREKTELVFLIWTLKEKGKIIFSPKLPSSMQTAEITLNRQH